MRPSGDPDAAEVLRRLTSLRQHQHGGRRSPHKPLLTLLALGNLARTGTSELSWPAVVGRLADLIREFGRPSRTAAAQAAAYPFTRLRSDGIWTLDHDVPMDSSAALAEHSVTGRLEATLERHLAGDPRLLSLAARSLVGTNFPDTIAPDVLAAVGLDPAVVLGHTEPVEVDAARRRRRQAAWRSEIIQAWDRQCAFCGYDGQLAGATVGLDAAHIRWFALDGPDTMDNGLALCALHHKLFDFGVLGLTLNLRIEVSTTFTARTAAGRAVYGLHGRTLEPRSEAVAPGEPHLTWHRREVFKGRPLTSG